MGLHIISCKKGSGAGGGSGAQYPQVPSFIDLPLPNEHVGEVWFVEQPSGGILGLFQNPLGLYYSDGTSWSFAGDDLEYATQIIYDNTASGLVSTFTQGAIDEVNTKADNNTTALGLEINARITGDNNLQTQITSNDTDIANNTSAISTNTGDIATNATNISTNSGDISALQSSQASQDVLISQNTGNLSNEINDRINGDNFLQSQITGNTSGVSANASAITAVQNNLTTHENDFTNPHNVTASQVGLNTTDDLSEGASNLYNRVPIGGTAGQVLEKVDATNYNTQWTTPAAGVTDHGLLTGLTDDDHPQYLDETKHDALPSDNPHGVTAAQVGLGNVDNTSDLNKPISTATQTALDLKADLSAIPGLVTANETDTTLTLEPANILRYVGENGLNQDVDLTPFLDNTNLSRITSGAVSGTDLILTRGDTTTVTVDVTSLDQSGAIAALATVATTGDYSDLINLPILGTAAAANVGDFATAAQGALADTATQPGDNISTLANDAGYINAAGVAANETDTTLTLLAGNILRYVGENGLNQDVDLTLYLDDTNLARLISGTVDSGTGIATFLRDDASTFTVDFSALFDDTNLTRITSGTVVGTDLILSRSDATTVTVDVSSLDNTALITAHTSDATIHFTEASIDHANIQNIGVNTHAQIDAHIASTANPHGVTASQVGLNTTDDLLEGTSNLYNRVPSGGTAGQVLSKIDGTDYNTQWVTGGGGGVTDHGALTGLTDDDHLQYLTEVRHDALPADNPHSVTAAQVGLGNVDNTSDLNKPISTATQTALDLKTDLTAFNTHTGDATIHFTEASIDHTAIQNIGTNTHAQIDSHIASTANPHSVTITQAVTADAGTDITTAELETLTDGSNADALHTHAGIGGPTGLNDLTDVDIVTDPIATSDLMEWNGTTLVPLSIREEGPVKVNSVVTSTLVTDGTKFQITDTAPVTFSTATRFPLEISNQFPGQTPTANPATYSPFIYDSATSKWLENPKDLQTHIWRVIVDYTRNAATTNRELIFEVSNPLSGFVQQIGFTMPNGAVFQTFDVEYLFVTIADSASIGFGYEFFITPNGDDVTINDLSITRASLAVL